MTGAASRCSARTCWCCCARGPCCVLLLLYPLLLAGIVAALTRDAGSRPRVAYVDQDGLQQQVQIGDSTVDYEGLLDDVRERVDLVPMDEQEAEDALSRGDVVATVTVPSGFVRTLRGMLQSPTITLRTRSGVVGERAIREVQSFVYDLNTALQDEFLRQNVEYLRLLVTGGKAQFLGDEIDILGLDRTAQIVEELRARRHERGGPGGATTRSSASPTTPGWRSASPTARWRRRRIPSRCGRSGRAGAPACWRTARSRSCSASAWPSPACCSAPAPSRPSGTRARCRG